MSLNPRTITLRVKPKGNGQPVDPAYIEQWDRFAARFNRGPLAPKGRKPVPKGQTKKFRARVVKITGPVWLGKRPFQSPDPNALEFKRYFQLDIRLREEGMESLRFLVDVTASLDNRSKFHALYYATTGEIPDEDAEDFTLDPSAVTTRDVIAIIKHTGDRKPNDKRRGGFYSDIVGFEEFNLDAEPDVAEPDAWVSVPDEGVQAKEEYESAVQSRAVEFAGGEYDNALYYATTGEAPF